jgi:hypothetical protein
VIVAVLISEDDLERFVCNTCPEERKIHRPDKCERQVEYVNPHKRNQNNDCVNYKPSWWRKLKLKLKVM